MDGLHTEILEESRWSLWDEMVSRHPMGSVFQHTAFGRVIAQTFPHTQPRYLALVDRERHLKAGIALFLVKSWLTGRRLVSLPFAFYSDPLIESQQDFMLLFEGVSELLRQERASYLEIKARRSTELLGGIDLLTPVYYHRTHCLDLADGLDRVWSRFHRTGVKQKIRRAEKAGIQVRPATSEADVTSFYALLTENRRKLGLPPQRLDYFRNVWRHLVPGRLAQFLIAEYTGQPVGGLCLFKFNDTVFLAYIGTDETLQAEGVGQCLWWQAIQDAIEEGFTTVDFGKSSPHAHGLLTYKERWGAQALETPVFYFPRVKGLSRLDNEKKLSHRLMRSAWRTMPEVLSRSAARMAYRHMG